MAIEAIRKLLKVKKGLVEVQNASRCIRVLRMHQDASGCIRMQKDAKGCNLVGAHFSGIRQIELRRLLDLPAFLRGFDIFISVLTCISREFLLFFGKSVKMTSVSSRPTWFTNLQFLKFKRLNCEHSSN